ncbi:hypothetical protein [Streptosporangium sp. NPDC087985]|uniref:hypothetical protein n=1 Tax=Streptosporangium sp. NPDC087985 TaxID=3366196 RepID=UPI0037FD70DA
MALVLLVLTTAGCSPEASPDVTSPDRAAQGPDGMRWAPTPPSDAKVPAVAGALQSHPGDEANFYVTTDDYVVWARSSANTKADLEYRVVSFDVNGWQSSAFMKYVFADAAEAKAFAATNELLVPDGTVVYYKGWFGPQVQHKAGVIELAKAEAEEHLVSKP